MDCKLIGFPPVSEFTDNELASQYLKHIGISCNITRDVTSLHKIMCNHVGTIPWENSELWFNKTVTLDIRALVTRYISSNCGGLCYQLNLTFYWLLQQLGFNAKLCLARVVGHNDKQYYRERVSHIMPVVHLHDQWYIADVGWSIIQSLILIADTNVVGDYKVIEEQNDEYNFLLLKMVNSQWFSQYRFSMKQITPLQWKQCLNYDVNDKEREVMHGFRLNLPHVNGQICVIAPQLTLLDTNGLVKEQETLLESVLMNKLLHDYGMDFRADTEIVT